MKVALLSEVQKLSLLFVGSCKRKWRSWKTIKIYLSFLLIFPRVSDPDNLSYLPKLVYCLLAFNKSYHCRRHLTADLKPAIEKHGFGAQVALEILNHKYPVSGFQVRSRNVRRKPGHTILRKCFPLTSGSPQSQIVTHILAVSTTILQGIALRLCH